MDKDDDDRSKINSSRILEEHSYYKIRNFASYPVKENLKQSMEKSSLSSSVRNGRSTERLVNGHANKAVEPSHLKPTFTSKDKNIKKARVEDIIMNLKKGKTVATTKRKVNNDSSSFISMCTIREEPDDDEIRDLPPLKSSPVFQQPEVKGNSNTVFLLQTSKQTQPAPSSTPYLGKASQTAPPSKSPVKQVINQNIIQRKVQKHDRYQMPLLLSKVPPGNVMNSDLLSNNAVNQKTTPNVLNSPSQPQKQLLLITRPGTPLYLAHNLKIHDRQGGSSKLSMKPLNVNTCTAVTTSHPMSEVQAANTTSPLVTLQYHLPNSDKAGKMVNLSNKYTYQVAPVQTSGSVPNLNCNETMSSLSDSESVPVAEMPRATKSLEIPISFAGNQPAHVTTISDEPGVVMQRRSNFVPSYVRGMANDMFSARKNLKQHNVSSSVEGRGKTALPIGHSGQNVAGNKKTDRGAAHKNIKSQESGKESFPAKKSSNISRIRANFPRSVDLDDISRTLSNEHSKPAQPKTSVTIVRMSNRKKHQTEKAKLLDKIKRKTKKCYKEPLKLRYSKKVKAKEKAQIKVKTEPVDECLATNPSVVNSSNVSEGTDKLTVGSPVKLLTKKGNELRENAQDGATSLPEVVNSSDDGQDSGNLFRDPALLTREERALQRALLMFKEMEAKQSRKNVRVGGKRSLRRRIKLKQFSRNTEVSRKRKLISEANDNSFLKRRKMKPEEQSIQRKAVQRSKNPVVKHEKDGDDDCDKNMKRRRIQLNDAALKKRPENVKKPPAKKPADDNIKDDKVCPNVAEDGKKTKQVKDVTNIPKSLKSSAKVPDKSADSVQEKPHRVKTYMLVPSYHGFQDFSPVVLGSRTRNKKADQVKSDKDDGVTPVEIAESPKKDIPLLVVETVNNKPVKQDVVAKDEEMRDLVKNSLRAQGMLKEEMELIEKGNDDDNFENREKRNISVNRNTGETVLHKASRMGYDETVYHCIHQGCDSNAKDYAGWTPLHEACSRGHPDVVKVLVKYNADVNACSNDGIRPIHDAADNGHTDVLRLLIAYGADPLLSTYSGRTCIDCAKNTLAKDYVEACIGDLYLTDERNDAVPVDYENRWDFRGSCSVLDKDMKYTTGIFDLVPEQQANASVEFEWSDIPHLPTYNLPLIKDDVVIGRKNFINLKDLQEALGKSRSTLMKMLKRTEIREVPWSEFSKEVSRSPFNKPFEPPTNDNMKVELVPLNWNVRCLLKIRSENVSL